jgi:hypothetical protein
MLRPEAKFALPAINDDLFSRSFVA